MSTQPDTDHMIEVLYALRRELIRLARREDFAGRPRGRQGAVLGAPPGFRAWPPGRGPGPGGRGRGPARGGLSSPAEQLEPRARLSGSNRCGEDVLGAGQASPKDPRDHHPVHCMDRDQCRPPQESARGAWRPPRSRPARPRSGRPRGRTGTSSVRRGCRRRRTSPSRSRDGGAGRVRTPRHSGHRGSDRLRGRRRTGAGRTRCPRLARSRPGPGAGAPGRRSR